MIYLVRHGLDDESYIGGYSEIDLIDIGRESIHNLGNWLKEQEFKLDRIYTSDVKRAVSTSNIINEYLQLPIIETSDLRELDKGLLNGMKKKKAVLTYPNFINVSDINVRYPNGESMLDLYNRIKKVLEGIQKYDNSIIVTHRGVINMIYYILNNIPLDMDKEKFGATHGSIHELDIANKKIRKLR